MQSIINHTDSQINTPTQVSNIDVDTHFIPIPRSSLPNNIPIRIPKLAYKLMRVMRDDYEATSRPSERTAEELGLRFRVHPVTIRKAFMYLAEVGFMISKRCGKGNASKRCITYVGFLWLEGELLHQTLHHNLPIPYIDLFSEKELDPLFEEQQECAQLQDLIPDPPDPIQRLDKFFEEEKMAWQERDIIKTAIERSKLGFVRKESLINRIVASKNKRSIQKPRSYFMACLRNEEKDLKEAQNYFRNKPVSVNFYAEQ